MTQEITMLRYSRVSEHFGRWPEAADEHRATLEYLRDRTLERRWKRVCIYCQQSLSVIDRRDFDLPWLVETWHCLACGWWHTWRTYEDEDCYQSKLYPALLLGMYPAQASDLPLDLLFRELNARPGLVRDIAPKVLEQFIGEILARTYDCEVNHVGRTGDGGIDLLVLASDKPIAVQVKRHVDRDYVEKIGVVREFVGAVVLKNLRRGIFVTTAKRFTRGAKQLAREEIPGALSVDWLELWDCKRLLDMYDLAKRPRDYSPWLALECYDEYGTLPHWVEPGEGTRPPQSGSG